MTNSASLTACNTPRIYEYAEAIAMHHDEYDGFKKGDTCDMSAPPLSAPVREKSLHHIGDTKTVGWLGGS